jgi:hypothetical protein
MIWTNSTRASAAVPETVHDGHEVEILRPLTGAEADLAETGPMFEVRCTADGQDFHVFGDELVGA